MSFVVLLLGVVIVGHTGDGVWRDGATEARLDGGAELAVIGLGEEDGQRVYFVDAELADVRLRGKKLPAKKRRPWPAATTTRWFAVEPHHWRQVAPARNGAGTPHYSNVVTGGDEHGRWLGYDEITYFETPLPGSSRRRPASVRPPRAEADVWNGLGTLRYRVEVTLGEATRSTPGAASVDRYGIRPDVHRVSIRKDDSTLGWLAAFFMVPEVFGSAGPGKDHQTERWVGADCADVLLGARRAGGHRGEKYTSVKGLTAYARVVGEAFAMDANGAVTEGAPTRGVLNGDIVRIDYAGLDTPRSWDHVALLWEDRSDPAGPARGAADGVLDGFDLVVHMGHPMLVVQPLARQLPARLDVLRWKKP